MRAGPDPLSRRVRATPDRPAVVEAATGSTLRYDELDGRVRSLAGHLAGLGLDAGDHLGLLAPTSMDSVALVHATWRLGLRLVPLNVRLAERELVRQASLADLNAVACVRATAATARSVVDRPVVSIDGPGAEPGDSDAVEGVEPLRSIDPVEAAPATWREDDPALAMFTSGTTTEPKAVTLTMGNMTASAATSAFRLGVLPSDRWLLCLPVYHMGGLAPVLRSALYGTVLVVQERDGGFDPEAVLTATHEHGVTGLSLVPTQLDRMLDADTDLADTVRTVLLGGAPAPQSLIDRCERLGVPVHPTYGMTETASQVATATPDQAFSHPGTVGQPLYGTEVTIVDDDFEPLPAGEAGEVVVSGPTVSPGYYDDPEATDRAVCEHGLRTGDVGRVDEAGRLWVTGRLDDRIVTGGENVHPASVADVLRTHPAVADAAVVGLPDAEWGERVAALVVAEAGSGTDVDLDEAALTDYCREHLAGYEVPRTVRFAEALPRTASGTVDRTAVRRALEG